MLVIHNSNHTRTKANKTKARRRLSSSDTLKRGLRWFDILHVASALKMTATHFIMIDVNQRELVVAEGLVVPL